MASRYGVIRCFGVRGVPGREGFGGLRNPPRLFGLLAPKVPVGDNNISRIKMEHIKRKSPRLKEYDYSQNGAYFVTICTQGRCNLFGLEPELTPMGKIAKEQIELLKNRYDEITIDKYVVMPNHITTT